MRIVIFSDIHGNFEAMEKFLILLDEEEKDAVYCLGDIVGYGADPNECVEAVRSRGIPAISGNHEDVVCGRTEPTDFNPDACNAILWCRAHISRRNCEYLGGLDDKMIIDTSVGKSFLVHGSPFDKDEYILSAWGALRSFEIVRAQNIFYTFIAHTHQPCLWVWKEGERVAYIPYSSGQKTFQIAPGLRLIVNVGSIGQPRDGNPDGCFVIWDTDKRIVEFIRFEYDVDKAQQKIIDAGLPRRLADRLACGR